MHGCHVQVLMDAGVIEATNQVVVVLIGMAPEVCAHVARIHQADQGREATQSGLASGQGQPSTWAQARN